PASRLRDLLEDLLLVSGVPLHRLHQIRDQVHPPLKDHLDLGPGGVDRLVLLHHPVVTAHQHSAHRQRDQEDHAEEDEAAHRSFAHLWSPPWGTNASTRSTARVSCSWYIPYRVLRSSAGTRPRLIQSTELKGVGSSPAFRQNASATSAFRIGVFPPRRYRQPRNSAMNVV